MKSKNSKNPSSKISKNKRGDAKKNILIINGPNLNLLGTREPEIYGKLTLNNIHEECNKYAKNLGLKIDFRQSNDEAKIIEWIQVANKNFSHIIINAGAYTHTSIAIRDALVASELPIIEVHISNIFKRESFRHHSFISDIAVGVICGFGVASYKMALLAV